MGGCGDDDGVRATSDEARDDSREAVTSGGDAGGGLLQSSLAHWTYLLDMALQQEAAANDKNV